MESIQKHISKDITKVYDQEVSHKTNTALRDLQNFCIGSIKINNITNLPFVNDKEYNYKVDLNKGILWQVWNNMRKDQYVDFIHDPKHMINPSEAILFDSKYLEIFTKTSWWVILLIWGPVIIYYLFQAYLHINLSISNLVVLYFFGILVWTFTEYVLHRFIFHIDEKLPDNSFILMMHFLLHGIHHAFPMDRNRLVFPPAAALPIFFLLKTLFSNIFGYIFPIVFAGTLTGYISYDLTHYFIHHNKPSISFYRNLKQYHILHHYNNPKMGFGVSNKIWDYVFNTVLKEVDHKQQ